MQWQEVRDHYPQQWVLIEAIQAHSEENKRIVEQVTVVSVFADSVSAMQNYKQLHLQVGAIIDLA